MVYQKTSLLYFINFSSDVYDCIPMSKNKHHILESIHIEYDITIQTAGNPRYSIISVTPMAKGPLDAIEAAVQIKLQQQYFKRFKGCW